MAPPAGRRMRFMGGTPWSDVGRIFASHSSGKVMTENIQFDLVPRKRFKRKNDHGKGRDRSVTYGRMPAPGPCRGWFGLFAQIKIKALLVGLLRPERPESWMRTALCVVDHMRWMAPFSGPVRQKGPHRSCLDASGFRPESS